MKIISPVFAHDSMIPERYTCDGDDINPPLEIHNAPHGVQSFVLIVDDPDASNGDWVHWVVWNIDPTTSTIAENAVPAGGVQGMTSFERQGWGGPCPPEGKHRYVFKVYALDTLLDLDARSRKADVERAMAGHVMEQAQLIGLYGRAL